MTVEQLQYFYVLSKHLNFTKAADALYISQPTLSRQISLLEDELGTALFYRNNRGVQLTSAGMLLLEDVPDILEKIDIVQHKIQRSSKGQEGFLSIYSVYFFYPELHQVYRKFTEMYPNVQLMMYKSDGNLFPDESEKLPIDIGIGFDFELAGNKEDISYIPLYRDKFCAVMSEDHELASKDSLTLEDISTQNLITLSRTESPFMQNIWSQVNRHHPSKVKMIHSSVIEDVVLHIRADKTALFLAPYPAISMMPPGCVSKEIVDLDSSYQVILAWRRQNRSVILDSFIELIQQEYADGPIIGHI